MTEKTETLAPTKTTAPTNQNEDMLTLQPDSIIPKETNPTVTVKDTTALFVTEQKFELAFAQTASNSASDNEGIVAQDSKILDQVISKKEEQSKDKDRSNGTEEASDKSSLDKKSEINYGMEKTIARSHKASYTRPTQSEKCKETSKVKRKISTTSFDLSPSENCKKYKQEEKRRKISPFNILKRFKRKLLSRKPKTNKKKHRKVLIASYHHAIYARLEWLHKQMNTDEEGSNNEKNKSTEAKAGKSNKREFYENIIRQDGQEENKKEDHTKNDETPVNKILKCAPIGTDKFDTRNNSDSFKNKITNADEAQTMEEISIGVPTNVDDRNVDERDVKENRIDWISQGDKANEEAADVDDNQTKDEKSMDVLIKTEFSTTSDSQDENGRYTEDDIIVIQSSQIGNAEDVSTTTDEKQNETEISARAHTNTELSTTLYSQETNEKNLKNDVVDQIVQGEVEQEPTGFEETHIEDEKTLRVPSVTELPTTLDKGTNYHLEQEGNYNQPALSRAIETIISLYEAKTPTLNGDLRENKQKIKFRIIGNKVKLTIAKLLINLRQEESQTDKIRHEQRKDPLVKGKDLILLKILHGDMGDWKMDISHMTPDDVVTIVNMLREKIEIEDCSDEYPEYEFLSNTEMDRRIETIQVHIRGKGRACYYALVRLAADEKKTREQRINSRVNRKQKLKVNLDKNKEEDKLYWKTSDVIKLARRMHYGGYKGKRYLLYLKEKARKEKLEKEKQIQEKLKCLFEKVFVDNAENDDDFAELSDFPNDHVQRGKTVSKENKRNQGTFVDIADKRINDIEDGDDADDECSDDNSKHTWLSAGDLKPPERKTAANILAQYWNYDEKRERITKKDSVNMARKSGSRIDTAKNTSNLPKIERKILLRKRKRSFFLGKERLNRSQNAAETDRGVPHISAEENMAEWENLKHVLLTDDKLTGSGLQMTDQHNVPLWKRKRTRHLQMLY